MKLNDLGPIEYWAEELTIPLYGITDTEQPMCRDNFLCIFKGNTCTFYFINNRHKLEADRGYTYFNRKNSVQVYSKQVRRILKKFDALKGRQLSITEVTDASRQWNRVYLLSEAIRLRKFEEHDYSKTWKRFQTVARLRLEMRKQIETILFPQSYRALKGIAKQNSVKSDDLFFYTYEELQNLLSKHKKPSQDKLKVRKKGYAYSIKNGKSTLYTGRKFKTLFTELAQMHIGKDVKELKGRGVSKGVVRGKVKVILHNDRKNIVKQTRNFKKGLILVTEMTRPQSLAAGQKAKAIITDEGGIISHAAILAREFHIPCIVGTKVATRVLKDGDEVEVDADNGIVRILKSND